MNKAKSILPPPVIPEKERWLHSPDVSNDLAEALAWAVVNLAVATNLDTLKLNSK